MRDRGMGGQKLAHGHDAAVHERPLRKAISCVAWSMVVEVPVAMVVVVVVVVVVVMMIVVVAEVVAVVSVVVASSGGHGFAGNGAP